MGDLDLDLDQRRQAALAAWTRFVEDGDRAAAQVRPEILDSWTRSGASIAPDVGSAPLADESETRSLWQGSPLQVVWTSAGDEPSEPIVTIASGLMPPKRRSNAICRPSGE